MRSASSSVSLRLACRLASCTGKRNTWTSHSPCKSESRQCAKARNHRVDEWIRPGRSDLDADDERTAAGDPDTARMGHLGAAGRRGHPRMRGSWLDAGSRRPACARAGLRHPPAKSRRPGSLRMRRLLRSGKCWIRSATFARSALLWVPREDLTWCRRRTSRASLWIPVRRRVRRPSS